MAQYSLTFTEWCSSGGTACAIGQSLVVQIAGATQNPRFLSANDASTSFGVRVTTSEGLASEETVSGVLATPALVGEPLQNLLVQRSSHLTGAQASYSFSVTLGTSPIP